MLKPLETNPTILTMSQKERERLKVVSRLVNAELSCVEAAESLGLCERQIYRIRDRYKSDGDEGLIHRLRGATSNYGFGYTLRKRVIELYRERYSDYGPTLFVEMIAKEHSNDLPLLDHETVRLWLLKAGLWSTKRARKAHRRKRERRASIGSLLQFDGSDHDWFEKRGPRCTLLVAIDDASGNVLMSFAASENTHDVLLTLRSYVEEYGIPREIYTDRFSVYRASDAKSLTDVGRAMKRLGVAMITAHSPQAKGRVERSNRTHQDRLVKALRREGINTIEAANRFLQRTYLRDHNKRFALTKGLKDVHRSSNGLDLDNIFCYQTTRNVNNDYTIILGSSFIQLERSENPLPPPGRSVTLRRWLKDNSLHIFWNEEELVYSRIKARPKHQSHIGRPPSPEHPWRNQNPIGKSRYLNRTSLNKRAHKAKKKIVSSTPALT